MKDLIRLLNGFGIFFFLKGIDLIYRYMLSSHCAPSAVVSAGGTRVMARQVASLPGRACDPAKKKPLSQ